MDSQELYERYTLICFSRPGYGLTSIELGTSSREQAEVAMQLLGELGISLTRKVILLAYSAGGPIAIEFALRYPSRVASSVWISAVTRSYWPGQAKGISEELSSQNQSALVKLALSSKLVQRAGMWVLRRMSIAYPTGTRKALRTLLSETSLWEADTIDRHTERILTCEENL